MEVLKKLSCFCGAGCFAMSLFGEPVTAQTSGGEASSNREAASKKEGDVDVEVYFKVLGWMNTMQSGIRGLALSANERSVYLEGVRLSLEGKEAPVKLGDIMEPMQKFLKDRAAESEKKHMAEVKVIAAENRKKGAEFVAKAMEANKNLRKTSSGLVYEIAKVGNDVKASEEDSVEIFYTGKLIDGKVFDESKEKTVTFPLNGVISGIKEGLLLLGEGGKATLYIPDNLGYGEYDIPGIPAGSLLVFNVEVVKVIKPVKSEPLSKTSADKKSDKNTKADKKMEKEADKGKMGK